MKERSGLPTGERLAILETEMDFMQKLYEQIDEKLDKILKGGSGRGGLRWMIFITVTNVGAMLATIAIVASLVKG